MSAFVRCPECEARVRLTESSAPGGRVHCPSCGAIFRPPPAYAEFEEEDVYERPRRRIDRSGPNNSALLIGVLVGAGVLVLFACAGLGVGLYWVLSAAPPQAAPADWQVIADPPARVEMEEQKEDYAQARAQFQTKLLRQGPSPQPPRPNQVTPPAGAREVDYVSGELRLKAWASDPPPANKKSPAVLYLHNGFAFGEDDWEQARPFRDAGFVVMMPMLRGENGLPGNHSLYYDEVNDVLAAGETLSKMPGVDPQRLYLAGHAEGGTLTLLTAMTSNRFHAAGSFSGSPAQNRLPMFLGVPFDSGDQREFQMRSPLAYARSFKCPVRLYYGNRELGRSSDTQLTAERARKAGLDVEAVSVPGDQITSVPTAMKRCITFFQQNK